MQISQSRRDFLASLSAAGAAGVLGARGSLADEGPPETTTIRLGKIPGICIAPQYVAEELLRAEGFTDVRYVESEAGIALLDKIARGELDFTLMFAAPIVVALDAGQPVTAVAGVHPAASSCSRNERVRAIAGPEGQERRRPRPGLEPAPVPRQHGGLRRARPAQDIDWVTSPRSSRCSCSPRARSTPSSAFRPSRRSCAPATSAT